MNYLSKAPLDTMSESEQQAQLVAAIFETMIGELCFTLLEEVVDCRLEPSGRPS